MGRSQLWTVVQNSRSKSQKDIQTTAFLGDISFGKEFQKRCVRLYLTHTHTHLFVFIMAMMIKDKKKLKILIFYFIISFQLNIKHEYFVVSHIFFFP